MPLYELTYNLTSHNRKDIRKELTELFINEEPGTGKEELSSKYHYIVETYDGLSIVIKRPAGLNKGYDFTVNVDSFYFKGTGKRHRNPSHNDVFSILKYVKTNYANDYMKVSLQINNIYNCKIYDFSELNHIKFIDSDGIERPIAIILLAIKWLFIEQDITYWNWSGRNMLMNGLIERGLV